MMRENRSLFATNLGIKHVHRYYIKGDPKTRKSFTKCVLNIHDELSLSTFLPIHAATTGVRATVGGNLIGDAAL